MTYLFLPFAAYKNPNYLSFAQNKFCVNFEKEFRHLYRIII